jgi:hypothetical protein
MLFFSMGISQKMWAQAPENPEEEQHHCFMEENSFSIGIAPQYALHIESMGAHARFNYNMGESFCFGPEVSYFDNGHETLLDLDVVAHYIFETKWVGIYPVAGLNYAMEKVGQHQEKNMGAVFGAGVHRNFKSFTGFLESTRVENRKDDWLFTLGIIYRFKI